MMLLQLCHTYNIFHRQRDISAKVLQSHPIKVNRIDEEVCLFTYLPLKIICTSVNVNLLISVRDY
jgi:hypothetical protein